MQQFDGSTPAIEEAAFDRILQTLKTEAQRAKQVHEVQQRRLKSQQALEDEKERVEKEKRDLHRSILQEQLQERQRKRQQDRQRALEPGIDEKFHGYPDRPETPVNERRANEKRVQQQFKTQLDQHMELRNKARSCELAQEKQEIAAMVNRFKDDISGQQDMARERKEAEKRFYMDGLNKAREAKLALEQIEHGFEGTETRAPAVPEKSRRKFVEKIQSLPTDLASPIIPDLESPTKEDLPTDELPSKLTPEPLPERVESPVLTKQERIRAKAMRIKLEMEQEEQRRRIAKIHALQYSNKHKHELFHNHLREVTPEHVRRRRSQRAREAIRRQVGRMRSRKPQSMDLTIAHSAARSVDRNSQPSMPKSSSQSVMLSKHKGPVDNPFTNDSHKAMEKRKVELKRSIAQQLSELEKLESAQPVRIDTEVIRKGAHRSLFVTQADVDEPPVRLPEIRTKRSGRGYPNSLSMPSLKSSKTRHHSIFNN